MERKTDSPNHSSRVRTVVVTIGVLGFGFWLGYSFDSMRGNASPMVIQSSEVVREARDFAEVFERELSNSAWDGVAVSMVVLDEVGEIWYASPLAWTAMCPASALKVLTTGAALGILGPDFRFETKLASAVPAGPVLDGDLVIVGGGDPTLSTAQLQEMVRELVDGGLRRIDGRVRSDASIFPEHAMSDHWNWGDVGNAYGAGAYGLNVDHNLMTLRFRAGAERGDDVEFLGSSHVLPDVSWHNFLKTVPRGDVSSVTVYSEPYGNRVTIRGSMSNWQAEHQVSAAIPNPPETAVAVVTAALRERGVEITGRPRQEKFSQQILATTRSVRLMEIIRNIHRTSNNLEAQCLFLMLAPQGDPVAVVREYWESKGVSFAALRMLDGSGLARANMIRAVDLAVVMHHALAGLHGGEFLGSLPDEQDCTVRSKPGWMSGVTTSVGAITTKGGRRMTYAFMANGVTDAQETRNLRGRLRAAVAGQGR